MKQFLLAFIVLLTSFVSYAQNIVISVAAKSPIVLYEKLNGIINQLPPDAAMVKAIAAMSFASMGAPNFEGIDQNANMGFYVFDNGKAIFILKDSDSALIYQILKNSACYNRFGNYSIIAGDVHFELSTEGVEFSINTEDVDPIPNETAKIAIETIKADLNSDLLVKIYPRNIGRLMHQDAPENFKALFNDEIESLTYSLSIDDSKAEKNFQILAKSGSACEKILKSLRKADEVPEAKFVSKDHYLTFESSLVSTKETISAISVLFEKYFNIQQSTLEIIKKFPTDVGTMAGYKDYGEDSEFISFFKSQMTAEVYLGYKEFALNSIAEILKNFLTKDIDNPKFKNLTISDKRECEIESVKLLSFKAGKSFQNIASVNGILISSYFNNSQENDSKNDKKFISEAIKEIKNGKLAENPLPSKIDDDFLVTYNFSKIKGEKKLEEFAAKVAPLVYRGNVEDCSLSIKTETPTSELAKLLSLRIKINALGKEEQKRESSTQEKESNPPKDPQKKKVTRQA